MAENNKTKRGADSAPNAVSILLQLETNARKAEDEAALFYIMANQTMKLVGYRQAVIWAHDGRKIKAVSGAAIVDAQTPYVRWLRKLFDFLASKSPTEGCQINVGDVRGEVLAGWREWALNYGYWIPLRFNGELIGGLFFIRDSMFASNEITLLVHLGETYAHAWNALRNQRKSSFSEILKKRKKRVLLIAGVVFVASMFLPVRLSALGEAEVSAEDLTVLRSPLEGTIDRVLVDPNEQVIAGQLVAVLDVQSLKNQLALAEKSRDVERVRVQQLLQKSLEDYRYTGDVGLAKASLQEKETEIKYLRDMLKRAEIRSPMDGVALFSDRYELIGQPVHIGGRIIDIANPYKTELTVWLSVNDAMDVSEGDEINLFLNNDPDSAIEAKVIRSSYVAEVLPEGYMAYRIKASFVDKPGIRKPRVGLRGVARIYGRHTTLGYYLFRRPVMAVRQSLGI